MLISISLVNYDWRQGKAKYRPTASIGWILCRLQLLSIDLRFVIAHTKRLKEVDEILFNVRFFMLSQWCFLKNIVHLRAFMLQRLLFLASVEIPWRRNAIRLWLRDKTNIASFRLDIWRLKLYETLSFSFFLQRFSTNADNICDQSIRCGRKSSTARQFSNRNFFVLTFFELSFFRVSRLWNNFLIKKRIDSKEDF